MGVWAARAQATLEEDEPLSRAGRCTCPPVLDGRRHLTGDLDAEAGDVVATALRMATTRDVQGEPVRTASRRRADALVDVCRHYLDHREPGTAGGTGRTSTSSSTSPPAPPTTPPPAAPSTGSR
jgi:hypothetical protein